MRKFKLVKVVNPEIVAYFCYEKERLPDYRCPECGYGLADDYSHCPHCGSELDWGHTDKRSEKFKKLVDSL